MKCWHRLLGCCIVIVAFTAAGIYSGKMAMDVFRKNAVDFRQHTVVIDPGHGGEDGGASTLDGKKESAYNLEIAVRLNDVMQLLGYRTQMIRCEDTAVYTKGETLAQKKADDLKQRVLIANQSENNVLVSIHQNHFSQPQYRGAQVFYAKNEQSQFLAQALQQSLVTALNPENNRKCKAGEGIYLLEKCKVCGVLVECGFLSNQAEASLLKKPDYQKKLACVIGSCIASNLS